MIVLKTLSDREYVANAFLIEKIECLPDTTITLTNGKKIVVKNTLQEVVTKCVDFFRSVYQIDYKSQILEKELINKDITNG